MTKPGRATTPEPMMGPDLSDADPQTGVGGRVTPVGANYCPRCGLWHEMPFCDHNPEAPCLEGCGRKRGWRWLGDDRREVMPRTRCWTCWASGLGLIRAPNNPSHVST